MNPFEPGGPEIPAAPIEIPTPDIPTANFLDIGQQFAEGAKKAGVANRSLELLSMELRTLSRKSSQRF